MINSAEGTNAAVETNEFVSSAARYDPATREPFGVVGGVVRYTEPVVAGQTSRAPKSYASDVQFLFNAVLNDDRVP